MHPEIADKLMSLTGSSQILHTQLLQKLWSGYGSLIRVTLNRATVIVKIIEFPNGQHHPRGWNSEISHQRKMQSYQVEMKWYQRYNENIQKAYSPRYLGSGKIAEQQYLVLEDLGSSDFKPRNSIGWEQVRLGLQWLAYFHARYFNQTPEDLWPTGTYWHLATRPEELAALTDQELKEAASIIDHRLNSAKYQTFVHGDAKLANFLFNTTSVAAVDFQYVGGGVGVKDVAYFLSSVYSEDELHQYAQKALDFYFGELRSALSPFTNLEVMNNVEDQWRELSPYAWCDFYRFLQGWSPGHPKMNSYSEHMKDKVLHALK